MSQLAALRDLDARIHKAFASVGLAFSDGVYTPPAAGAPSVLGVCGYLNRGVQVLGEFEQVVDRRDEVELLRSTASPAKNGWIDVDGDRYVLDARVAEDESRSTWVIRRLGATP